MQADHDILIVGGGMVGASLACALGDSGLRVAVIEAMALSDDAQPSYDDRGLVISPASRRIFEGIGLWPELCREACAVEHIHVSEQGGFGISRLEAADMAVAALGHIVIARNIGKALVTRMRGLENIELHCPATVQSVSTDDTLARVRLRQDDGETVLSGRLLVIADGVDSAARKQLGIRVEEKDYQQSAVVANLRPEFPHRNTAYERFTRHGPLALLPLGDGRCVSVWAVHSDDVEARLALDEAAYLEAMEAAFGQRLGRLRGLGRRRAYPLRLVRVRQQYGPRFVLIGNAAHGIHPNAAQGLNLGLRDVAALAERLCDCRREGGDCGAPELLRDYSASRSRDQRRVMCLSDGLATVFYNDLAPLCLARNLGMLALDCLPPLKRRLMRQAMGLAGAQPRLVRGLPL